MAQELNGWNCYQLTRGTLWTEQILGGRSGVHSYIYILSLRCLFGILAGIMTSTNRLVVMIKYGECKSLSTESDVIISVRSDNVLLYETRIRDCKREKELTECDRRKF